MKVFYSPGKGILKGRLIPVGNKERINNTEDKIVVKEFGSDYHVFILQNGEFDIEKKVFDYYELVEFLKNNELDVYFVPVDELRLKYLMDDIRKKAEVKKPQKYEKKNPIIVTKEKDSILLTEASIDRSVVRSSLIKAYDYINIFDYVKLTNLLENDRLLKLYSLPIKHCGKSIAVPSREFASNDLFYGLSDIYSREGDTIYLDSNDLHMILGPRVLEEDRIIKQEITENIIVQDLDSFDAKLFGEVSDFIDNYSNRKLGIYQPETSIQKDYSDAFYNEDIYHHLNIKKENRRLIKEPK